MKQGLRIDPLSMLDLFRYHRHLFYYPHPDVIDMYVDHFSKQGDYENNGKKLILTFKNEHWLKKTDKYYNAMIDCAYRHGDKLSVERLYVDILDYDETKLSTYSINLLLDSIDLEHKALFEHIVGYIDKHKVEKNFCTYLLLAANSGSDQQKFNAFIDQATSHAKSTGNCKLIKSERIRQEVLIKYKDYNSHVQEMIKATDAASVLPEEPGFYDWKLSAQTSESKDHAKSGNESAAEEKADAGSEQPSDDQTKSS